MPVTIVVPQLGESVVEGTVGKWLKKEGDPIAKDEPIVEIITDKINIELPAPSAGTLGKITIPEGTVAQVGQQLGVILGPGESLPSTDKGAPAQAKQPQQPQRPESRPGPSMDTAHPCARFPVGPEFPRSEEGIGPARAGRKVRPPS